MIVAEMLARAAQARREDRLEDARRELVEAVDLCRSARPAHDLARALAALGQIERDLDHLDSALHCYSESAALFELEHDHPGLAHSLRHAADLHREVGRFAAAESEYEEVLRLYRHNPDTPPLNIANTLRGLALLKEHMGDRDTARSLWVEAREIYAAAGVEQGVEETSRRIDRLTAGQS